MNHEKINTMNSNTACFDSIKRKTSEIPTSSITSPSCHPIVILFFKPTFYCSMLTVENFQVQSYISSFPLLSAQNSLIFFMRKQIPNSNQHQVFNAMIFLPVRNFGIFESSRAYLTLRSSNLYMPVFVNKIING